MGSRDLHAAAKTAGSLVALMVVWIFSTPCIGGAKVPSPILPLRERSPRWVLDGLQSLTDVGNVFVWLHVTSVFAGGVLFALVWLPRRFQHVLNERWLLGVIVATLLFGIGSMAFPSWVPPMIWREGFTGGAITLSLTGGLLRGSLDPVGSALPAIPSDQ